MYSYNPGRGQTIRDNAGSSNDLAFVAHKQWSAAQAAAADADAILDGAVGPSGAEADALVVTPDDAAFLAQPPCPRNLVVTVAATTAGDVSGDDIVIAGFDAAGNEISEMFAVTVDTPATITGSKAFAEITSITIPVQDGESVTVDVGWGDKLGLGYLLAHNTVLAVYLNDAKEATAPTVAVSATVLAANTIDLNSALDGHVVDAYLLV